MGYCIWLTQFSVLRYAIPLEMLIGIMIAKLAADFFPKTYFRQILYISFLFMVLGILMQTTFDSVFSSSFRRNTDKVVEVEPIHIPENSIILLYRLPSAGVTPFLIKDKKNIRIIAMDQRISPQAQGFDLTNSGKFLHLKQQLLQNHKGHIVALIRNTDIDAFEIDDNLFKNKKCRKLLNSFDQNLTICM